MGQELPNSGVLSIDGRLVGPAEARVSVFDRGFLYGDSVFEVMRTYGGVPFCEAAHLRRLQRSCERVFISLPVGLDVLSREIEAAVAASELADCYLRVVITRGAGPMGLDLDTAVAPSRLIYALPLKTPSAETYERGIAVGLVRTLRGLEHTAAAGAKTSNYLASALALHEVKARGCQEAVLVGSGESLVEGATSNIFVLHGKRLRTPPPEAGILEGITRGVVMELAFQAGLDVEEATLHVADLESADEAFITSSIREIVPVVHVDGRRIAGGMPGPVTDELMRAYRERAHRPAA